MISLTHAKMMPKKSVIVLTIVSPQQLAQKALAPWLKTGPSRDNYLLREAFHCLTITPL